MTDLDFAPVTQINHRGKSMTSRGILKLADYFREAKNPCLRCGETPHRRSSCLDCKGTGVQSASEKKRLYG